jgi:hypothetical protein
MYIPPSQYKTGFYSNGDYVDNQGSIYVGHFYKLKNNKTFTGKSPNTDIPGNNIQIFPLSTTLPQSTDDPKLNVVSDAVIQQKPGKIIPNPDIDLEPSQRSLPTPYFPQLTQTNIDEGVFTRYFLKRNDQFLYIEINFEEYEHLSTPGGEYKTSDGKEYIGLYHIHPEKGPMVGATHISAPHDYLYSIKRNIRSILTGSTSPTTPNYTPPPSIGGSFSGGGY